MNFHICRRAYFADPSLELAQSLHSSVVHGSSRSGRAKPNKPYSRTLGCGGEPGSEPGQQRRVEASRKGTQAVTVWIRRDDGKMSN